MSFLHNFCIWKYSTESPVHNIETHKSSYRASADSITSLDYNSKTGSKTDNTLKNGVKETFKAQAHNGLPTAVWWL